MQKDNFQGHNNTNPAHVSSQDANVVPFQSRLSGTPFLSYGEEYSVYAQKMHKILIALYMVTDLVETNHAVKDTLRAQATQALSCIYGLHHSEEFQRHTEKLRDIHILLDECSSYFDVLFRTGFISPMNYQVILAEIQKLQDIIHIQHEKLCETMKGTRTSAPSFRLPTNFFDVDEQEKNKGQDHHAHPYVPPSKSTPPLAGRASTPSSPLKDKEEETIFVPKSSMSSLVEQYKNKRTNNAPAKPKTRAKREPQVNEAKDARKENILKILKQKKDASITDICSLFKDCSSKTIQRDLNELIDEHKVIKKGSRRWSTYNLAR